MGVGLGCGLAEVLGRLGLRVWQLLLEGFVGFAGELDGLCWKVGCA